MTLVIASEDPLSPDGRELIAGSEAALRAVYTEDECFTFTAEELCGNDISFLVARAGGQAVGCVALCDYRTYGEIKRLYVTAAGRGTGVAQALMAALEDMARQAGHRSVRLETGTKLAAAVALYERLGYRERGPFGQYSAHPASMFMQKDL